MTTPINLRQKRKAKARDAKRDAATENAAKHGRSKAEKAAADRQKSADLRHLDGHKRTP